MDKIKGKLLVTGGAGFIGRNVVKKALDRGYQVWSFDLNPCQINGSNSIVGDILDIAAVNAAVSGMDYVIHMAAITVGQEFDKNMHRCYEINVSGFKNVIDAALKHNVKRFLYASSSYVYCDDFSEEAVLNFRVQRNHYAKSKMMNEMIAESYIDSYKMNVTGMRFFNTYGIGENSKGEYTSIVSKFLNYDKKGRVLDLYGDGKQSKDLIYVEDAATIAILLLEKGKHPLYNVGTGTSTRYRDVAEAINKEKVVCVPNPLPTYQTYTRADTKRLLETIGPYEFVKATDAVKGLQKNWKPEESK